MDKKILSMDKKVLSIDKKVLSIDKKVLSVDKKVLLNILRMLYSQPYEALHRRRGPSTKTRSSSPHVEVENKRISGRLGHARHSSNKLGLRPKQFRIIFSSELLEFINPNCT